VAGTWKELENALRRSVGRDVEIVRVAAQQQVPDATPYEVRAMPGTMQSGCRTAR